MTNSSLLTPACLLALVAAPACGGDPASGGGDDPGAGPDAGVSEADAGPPERPEPATRFAEQAVTWAVPGSGRTSGFYAPAQGAGAEHWLLVDLTGDGLRDIVQTADATGSNRVWDASGAPHWKVFENTGDGFSAGDIRWPVPDPETSGGLYTANRNDGTVVWQLMDIDGDDDLELVQSSDPATGDVWDEQGSPYWKVFDNRGDGFATAAVRWPVPRSGFSQGFEVPTASSRWATLDLTGDGRPDLVHTEDPATGNVWDRGGDPHWKLYENLGDGFADTAVRWPVPTTGSSRGHHSITGVGSGRWSTFDLDGDGRPDLVQTSDPATGDVWDETGDPHWNVFLNEGDGFSGRVTAWPVPAAGVSGGFFARTNDADHRRWSTFDIDGDGAPDLVQTGDVAHPSRVWDAAGAPYWKVYLNDGEGFGELVRWPVPGLGDGVGYFAVSRAQFGRFWTCTDIDGDDRPDLVHTADPATSRIWDASGAPYWKVYRAE